MVARKEQIFWTAEVAEILGIPEWRVIKIATGEEYGIKPRRSAKGSGTRRMYDIENVCAIALAVRLLETGLRPKVIGDVIRKLRMTGRLSSTLRIGSPSPETLYLAVGRHASIGRPLNQSRHQRVKLLDFEQEGFEAGLQEFLNEMSESFGPDVDVLLVAVGPIFKEINMNLERKKAEEGK
jgi:hypothetical protein